MMQSIAAPDKMARSKFINAVSAFSEAFAPVVISIAEGLGDSRRIDQAIVAVERIGSEAENKITLGHTAADHWFANGQGQQAPLYAWRSTSVCGQFVEINACHTVQLLV
jgi:hypothetical protein